MTAEAPKKLPTPARGVDYRGKVVLAPMVRSSELPSRLLALHYGADLVWGPETVDRALIGTTRRVNPTAGTIDFTRPKHTTPALDLTSSILDDEEAASTQSPPHENTIFRLHPTLESRRLIFQLGTSDPDRAVAAARLIAPDVAGIDVNAGCPKPFSTSGGMGAALLRDPDRLCAILHALVAAVGPASPHALGVSVKIRILEDPDATETLVRALCDTGINALTVHCRTPAMRPRERAIRHQLPRVAAVCRAAGVVCLMNGDVASRADAKRLLAEEFSGVDGAMIASAAEKNPSCFRADAGLLPWDEVVARYVETAMRVENKWGNTKFLLGNMIPGKQPAHRAIAGCQGYEQACGVLGLGVEMKEMGRRVDEKLGLGEFREAAKSKTKTKTKGKNQSAKAGSGKGGGQAKQQNGGGEQKNPSALATDRQMARSREQNQCAKRSLSERDIVGGAEPAAELDAESGHKRQCPFNVAGTQPSADLAP